MKKYIYRPNFLDQYEPCIVLGQAIAPESIVTLEATAVDPARIFVWIADEKGSIQSVMKSSLVSLKQAL